MLLRATEIRMDENRVYYYLFHGLRRPIRESFEANRMKF
jgi:hypothetical protein